MKPVARVIAIAGSALILIMSATSILREENASYAETSQSAKTPEQKIITPVVQATTTEASPVKKAPDSDTTEIVFKPLGNISEFLQEHPEARETLADFDTNTESSRADVQIGKITDKAYFLYINGNGHCGNLGCSLTGFSKTSDGYIPAVYLVANLPLHYNTAADGTVNLFFCGPDNTVSKWKLNSSGSIEADDGYLKSPSRPQCSPDGLLPSKVDIEVNLKDSFPTPQAPKESGPTPQSVQAGSATSLLFSPRASSEIASDYPLIAEAMLPLESTDGTPVVSQPIFPEKYHEAAIALPEKNLDLYLLFNDTHPWCVTPELCEITLYKRDGQTLTQILSVHATKDSYFLAEKDSISLIVCNRDGKYTQWRMADGSLDIPIGPDHPEYFEMVGEYKGTDIKTTCPAPPAKPTAPAPKP